MIHARQSNVPMVVDGVCNQLSEVRTLSGGDSCLTYFLLPGIS